MSTPAGRALRRGLLIALTAFQCAAAPAVLAGAGAEPKPAAPARTQQDPFTRGMELFKQGKLDPAIAALREAEKAEPQDAIIQSWLGFVLFKRGRYDEAIGYLKQSITLSGANPDVYNNLGNAYLAKSDVENAVESYRQAVNLVKEKPGQHADVYYNLGNALVRKRDLDGALAAFLEAEKQDGKDPLIHNNLGYVYEQKYEIDRLPATIETAIRQYQQAAELEPKNAVFQRNLGLAARRREGQSEVALKALKNAVELDPKDYLSHVALAEEYQTRKQMPLAITEYKTALALRPVEFVPRYNLGLLYARQDPPNFAEAIFHLQKAASLRAADQRVLSALGYVNFQAKRYEDAAKWYEKVVQAAPDFQAGHANLGMVMERLGNVDRAIQCWKEALKLDPNDGSSRSLLAAAYLSKARYEDAASEYGEVVKRDPKDGSSYNNLGFALEKLNKMEEAIAAYQHALDANPKLAVAWNNLGAIYQRQGQKDKARDHYEKALAVDPKYDDARKNLERLERAN